MKNDAVMIAQFVRTVLFVKTVGKVLIVELNRVVNEPNGLYGLTTLTV